MSEYWRIEGLWDKQNTRTFFGRRYTRFLAQLPRLDGTEEHTVPLFVPDDAVVEEHTVEDAGPEGLVEIKVKPESYLVRLVPTTIALGDPGLTEARPALIYAEDVEVTMSFMALPAS